MTKGKIIYLEGASGSGKTTLARTLQTKLPEPFFWLAGDMVWNMAPPPNTFGLDVLFPKIESSIINMIKLYSELDIGVIVDIVPVRMSNSMDKFVEALHEFPVIYVNVTCSLEELRRREKERGRRTGSSESDLIWIAPKDTYDITVDTATNTSEECADKIIEMLNYPEKFKAFENLWLQRTK